MRSAATRAARGPEGERDRDREERGHAEQDRPADPGVGAVVGPRHVLHAGEAPVQAVRKLAPVRRQQQAAGKARRHQPKGQCRDPDRGGERVQRRARQRRSREQPKRGGAAGGHQQHQQRAADWRVLDEHPPVRRGERGQRCEGDQPHHERVVRDRCGGARAAGGGGRGLLPRPARGCGQTTLMPRSGCRWHAAPAPRGSRCSRPPRTRAARRVAHRARPRSATRRAAARERAAWRAGPPR